MYAVGRKYIITLVLRVIHQVQNIIEHVQRPLNQGHNSKGQDLRPIG